MLARHPDYAAPHAVIDGEQRRLPVRLIKARPAGGICASIAEMAAWMNFHLDPITGVDDLRLSPAAATELTAPQIYIGRPEFGEIGPLHYGFGFFVGRYRRARCIDHSGGPWSGYNCGLRLLPDHGSGVMVLTNGHDSGCAPLTNTVLDHLLGLEPLPWLDRLPGPARFHYRAPEHQSARATVHYRDTRPSHALVDYAHEFAHPACGTVRIISAGDGLRWRGIGLDLPIVYRYRTFSRSSPSRLRGSRTRPCNSPARPKAISRS
jgi:hypothetical protein